MPSCWRLCSMDFDKIEVQVLSIHARMGLKKFCRRLWCCRRTLTIWPFSTRCLILPWMWVSFCQRSFSTGCEGIDVLFFTMHRVATGSLSGRELATQSGWCFLSPANDLLLPLGINRDVSRGVRIERRPRSNTRKLVSEIASAFSRKRDVKIQVEKDYARILQALYE